MDNFNDLFRRFGKLHESELLQDDNVETVTSKEQRMIEGSIQQVLQDNLQRSWPVLLREQHAVYLTTGLQHLRSESSESLDTSRAWLCYWILHSLHLLAKPVSASLASDVCEFLATCQCPTGGFGGGPGQYAHLAPTYAAVNALCTIGTEEAYNVIDREKLLEFLYSLRQPDGSFVLHADGELDLRGVYCAASVAALTNLITPTLFEHSASWIGRCQSWEGGLGGLPGMEAHGGYTFCGMAALAILKKEHVLDLKALLCWLTHRQMRFEGGFQGRCNKLVDGCYSFWLGSPLALVYHTLSKQGAPGLSARGWLFEQGALQAFLLLCCQSPDGGLLDKPGKTRDFYHTCYCLSGLSIAQHFNSKDVHLETVLGGDENRLGQTHPVHNISSERVVQAMAYFSTLPTPHHRDQTAAANPP